MKKKLLFGILFMVVAAATLVDPESDSAGMSSITRIPPAASVQQLPEEYGMGALPK